MYKTLVVVSFGGPFQVHCEFVVDASNHLAHNVSDACDSDRAVHRFAFSSRLKCIIHYLLKVFILSRTQLPTANDLNTTKTKTPITLLSIAILSRRAAQQLTSSTLVDAGDCVVVDEVSIISSDVNSVVDEAMTRFGKYVRQLQTSDTFNKNATDALFFISFFFLKLKTIFIYF